MGKWKEKTNKAKEVGIPPEIKKTNNWWLKVVLSIKHNFTV